MGVDFVWNEAAAEDIRAESEAAMRQQAENMEETRRAYIAIAEDEGRKAAIQEHIAATAMTTDSDGHRVPDWPRRNEARRKAEALRGYEAALYESIDRLYWAISKLEDDIVETNKLFNQLQNEAQQTDLAYARQVDQITDDILAYNRRMQEVYDSFNDSFPFISAGQDVSPLLNYYNENGLYTEEIIADPGTLQTIADEWQKLGKAPCIANLCTALGETLKHLLAQPIVKEKTNMPDTAYLIEGFIDGVEGIAVMVGGIGDYALGSILTGLSHVPVIKQVMPQAITDWGKKQFDKGNAAVVDFAGIGTPNEWIELGVFVLAIPVMPTYLPHKALYCAVTKQEFHTIPSILERLGEGMKEQVADIYEDKGPVNGSLYIVGELIPLVVGTKGLGTVKGGKAVAGTADAAIALREGKAVAGVTDAAIALREGQAVAGALDAASSARLIGIKNILEDLQAYSKLPELAMPGAPGVKMTFKEFQAMQNAERMAAEIKALEGVKGAAEVKVLEGAGSKTFSKGLSMPDEILQAKPRYSPAVDRWLENGGKITIENGTWKYTNSQGVSVTYKNGYPDFKGSGHVKQEVDIGGFNNRAADFKKADQLAPQPKSPDSTWHHSEDGRTLQEVNRRIHEQFRHIGGISEMQ